MHVYVIRARTVLYLRPSWRLFLLLLLFLFFFYLHLFARGKWTARQSPAEAIWRARFFIDAMMDFITLCHHHISPQGIQYLMKSCEEDRSPFRTVRIPAFWQLLERGIVNLSMNKHRARKPSVVKSGLCKRVRRSLSPGCVSKCHFVTLNTCLLKVSFSPFFLHYSYTNTSSQ